MFLFYRKHRAGFINDREEANKKKEKKERKKVNRDNGEKRSLKTKRAFSRGNLFSKGRSSDSKAEKHFLPEKKRRKTTKEKNQ